MKTYVAYEGDIEYTGVVYAGSDLDVAKSKQEDENLDFWIDVWEKGKIIGCYTYIVDEDTFLYENREG